MTVRRPPGWRQGARLKPDGPGVLHPLPEMWPANVASHMLEMVGRRARIPGCPRGTTRSLMKVANRVCLEIVKIGRRRTGCGVVRVDARAHCPVFVHPYFDTREADRPAHEGALGKGWADGDWHKRQAPPDADPKWWARTLSSLLAAEIPFHVAVERGRPAAVAWPEKISAIGLTPQGGK